MSTPPPVKLFKAFHTSSPVQSDDIKLLESGRFSDVTFIVGESKEEVKAHKFKLVRSPVFEANFERWETGKDITIDVPEVEAEPFRLFLKFLYTDEFSSNVEQLPDVLYLADKYDVEALRTLCNDHLKTGKNVRNVVEIYRKATNFRQEALMEDSFKLMLSEGEQLYLANKYLEFDYDLFLKFIRDDRLEMREIVVFYAVLIWCHREEKRTVKNNMELLKSLLCHVRFPLLSEKDFTEKIALKHKWGMLTSAEFLEVYAYFHSSKEKFAAAYPNPTFLSRPRNCSHSFSVNLYDSHDVDCKSSCRQSIHNFGQGGLGDLHVIEQGGSLQCCTKIEFQVDKSIIIKGIEIDELNKYVHDEDDSGDIKYKLSIEFLSLGEGDPKVVASFEVKDFNNSSSHKIFFGEEVQVSKNDKYAIKFSVSGKLSTNQDSHCYYAYAKPFYQIIEKICRGNNIIFRFNKNVETCATKHAFMNKTPQCISEYGVRGIIFQS